MFALMMVNDDSCLLLSDLVNLLWVLSASRPGLLTEGALLVEWDQS